MFGNQHKRPTFPVPILKLNLTEKEPYLGFAPFKIRHRMEIKNVFRVHLFINIPVTYDVLWAYREKSSPTKSERFILKKNILYVLYTSPILFAPHETYYLIISRPF